MLYWKMEMYSFWNEYTLYFVVDWYGKVYRHLEWYGKVLVGMWDGGGVGLAFDLSLNPLLG